MTKVGELLLRLNVLAEPHSIPKLCPSSDEKNSCIPGGKRYISSDRQKGFSCSFEHVLALLLYSFELEKKLYSYLNDLVSKTRTFIGVVCEWNT